MTVTATDKEQVRPVSQFSDPGSAASRRIRHLAWFFMVGGFVLLAAFCVVTSAGIHLFLFRSISVLDTTVAPSRGTVPLTTANYTDRAIRTPELLREFPFVTRTDNQSQLTVTFDIAEASRSIAHVVMSANSGARILQAVRPRFVWGEGSYVINIADAEGTFDIIVSPGLTRDIEMNIRTTEGGLIRINGSGRYGLSVTDRRVTFSNYSGEPVDMYSEDRSRHIVVSPDQDAVYVTERNSLVTGRLQQNLLENSIFGLQLPLSREVTGGSIPAQWQCVNVQNDLPEGRFYSDVWYGEPAIRLSRTGGSIANGQTRCYQDFEGDGIPVSSFNTIELVSTFLINYQSLSQCGSVDGSECPVMYHIEYTDTDGVLRDWYHGFYAFSRNEDYFKSRCPSCLQDNEQISEQVWYTYRSGNLFTLLDGTQNPKPSRIHRVEFYASGHDYDVFVSDIMFLAGQGNAIMPTVQTSDIVPPVLPSDE